MLKIGEFSKLYRISVRMLPHYDETGLLKAAEIDRFTDDRYYRENQFPNAVPPPRHGAREVPDAAGGYDCQLHLPGQLHPDHRGLCRCHCVDGSEWI